MNKNASERMKTFTEQAETLRQQDAESIKQPDATPSNKQTTESTKQGRGRPVNKQDAKKLTSYIPPELATALNRAWVDLQEMLPDVKPSQLTKSTIVTIALQEAFKDFEAKGESSKLAKGIKRAAK